MATLFRLREDFAAAAFAADRGQQFAQERTHIAIEPRGLRENDSFRGAARENCSFPIRRNLRLCREEICGFEFRETLGQLFRIALAGTALVLNFTHHLRRFRNSAAELLGGLAQCGEVPASGSEGAEPRDEFDAPLLFWRSHLR